LFIVHGSLFIRRSPERGSWSDAVGQGDSQNAGRKIAVASSALTSIGKMIERENGPQ